ncbi:MAG: polysaccharide biosynthesis/export family protein [Bryobacterales bacterium]|nr:polysaccharide biosynthesis/export family protein [Bryobacteraceae bacterium]MDW8353838.1 polysaccharide biosynthesis/export family protein [Bryobacterales bacterium]
MSAKTCVAAALFCLISATANLGAQQDRSEPQPAPAPVRPGDDENLRRAVGLPVDPKSYIIGPDDILVIRVWREPDLSGAVGVRPDGKISLPLIGEIQAGGMTPATLAERITEGFSKYINNPEVIVQVAAVNSKKYFISGEVQRPGSYPLVSPTTVLAAIAIAGGFRDYADRKNIIIMRGPKRFKFNYNDVIKGKRVEQNLLLENGDHIIVP